MSYEWIRVFFDQGFITSMLRVFCELSCVSLELEEKKEGKKNSSCYGLSSSDSIGRQQISLSDNIPLSALRGNLDGDHVLSVELTDTLLSHYMPLHLHIIFNTLHTKCRRDLFLSSFSKFTDHMWNRNAGKLEQTRLLFGPWFLR